MGDRGQERARMRMPLRCALAGVLGALLALGLVAAVGLVGPGIGGGAGLPSARDARSGSATPAASGGAPSQDAPPRARSEQARPDPGATDGYDSEATRSLDVRLRIVSRVLQRRATALEERDRAAYLATVDPQNQRLVTRAGRTYANLVRMRVADVRFTAPAVEARDLTRTPRQQLGPGSWVARSELSFRLPGPSRYRWTTTLRVALVERAGRWYVAGHHERAGAGQPRPLWMQGRVEVVRGNHSTVIGTGTVQRLRTYARLADRAVPAVSETWGRDWGRHVVVVVPGSEEQMERRLGVEPGSQRQVASVTTTAGRSDPERAPYILINPASFTGIGDIGQQVVLTHETVHVATRATTTVVPVWLSEGFADYVGFSHSGLAPRIIGHQLIERVHNHGVPERLPGEPSFAPQAEHLERAYEEAWSACRYIAHRWGEATLVKFYRAMDGTATDGATGDGTGDGATAPNPQARAYRTVLGTNPPEFLDGWRSYVKDLAG